MSLQEILIILKAIQTDVIYIKEHIPQKRLSLPPGYNPKGKGKCFSQKLRGGLKDPEIRAAIMRLKKEGKRFEDIAAYIREHWPRRPEKHIPRSTIHRFYQSARNGRLREYGIDPPVEL